MLLAPTVLTPLEVVVLFVLAVPEELALGSVSELALALVLLLVSTVVFVLWLLLVWVLGLLPFGSLEKGRRANTRAWMLLLGRSPFLDPASNDKEGMWPEGG